MPGTQQHDFLSHKTFFILKVFIKFEDPGCSITDKSLMEILTEEKWQQKKTMQEYAGEASSTSYNTTGHTKNLYKISRS